MLKTRMAKLEKLKKRFAKGYVAIYENQDNLDHLFTTQHISNQSPIDAIDHGYIDSFLAEVKEEIVREIMSK